MILSTITVLAQKYETHMAKVTDIKFYDLCTIFQKISETKKRIEIQNILTEFYKKVIEIDPESLIAVLYLCNGTLAPDHHNKELGIGESIIIKVISEASSRSIKAIREEYKVVGDLGTIASKYKSNQLSIFKKKDLSVIQVYEELMKISSEEGSKSQNAKQRRMLYLISNTVAMETKYLIRIFEGKLKIGLALKTILISLSFATSSGDNINYSENLKTAYNCQPSFETIIPLLLKYGSKEIHNHISIKPGIPLKPMLAQPSKNITAAFKRLSDFFTCEYKYDGERAQIHKYDNTFKIYSRSSEDLTNKYPDLHEVLRSIAKNDVDFVLDSEIVAFDIDKNVLLPFQILSTRKRKNVDIKQIKVSICIYAFDILYFNNAPVINYKLRERRKILFDNFNEISGKFRFVTFLNCSSVDEVDSFFNQSIKDNCEGLMIKNLETSSEYTPSKRCYNWIKIKKDYIAGMSDSLDLIVLGCYHGKGKRTGSYGGFLMGCYNDEYDVFETICKLGTGFTDETLTMLYNKLKPLEITYPQNIVDKGNLDPDLWIEPKYVWEIQASGFSLSPIYSAGKTYLDGKGLSLRFPRFIRERSDKNIKDSTSSSQITLMYKTAVKDEVGNNDNDSDDY